MKKLLVSLMAIAMTVNVLAADLSLVVDAASNGRVDDKNIDVSTITAGDKFTLCIVLSNLDFTLAGAEYSVIYPTFLTLVNVSLIGTGDPPYKVDTTATGLDTTSVQKLPADNTGADTGTTIENTRGRLRIGFVITDPAERPSTGDRILAKLDFVAGRDYNLTPAARSEPTCITATKAIRLVNSNTGSALDPIFADETASPVLVTGAGADLLVNINNTDTTIVKGDVNKSGSISTLDVGPGIQCAVFGQASALCPWSADTATDYLIGVDINCSGAVTTPDVNPLINIALGNFGFFKNYLTDFFKLTSSEGVLEIHGDGNAGSVASVEFEVRGGIEFGDKIKLDDAAARAGWIAAGQFSPEVGVYKFILANMKGDNALLPSLQIPYSLKGDSAEIAIRVVENYLADSTSAPYRPIIDDYSLATEKSRERVEKE